MDLSEEGGRPSLGLDDLEFREIVRHNGFGAGPFGGLHHGERCDRTELLNTVKLMVRLYAAGSYR